ncbi:oxalate transporter [Russula earlei]|uniref:Oxalate transporter n=2 Tax=Russula earlei TaxID=71964 RepID=A0ACC0U689_9AGAM|nr:oxalate transporter [Russula earlei]KAI9512943.1 oxalate transporter [Russula earlei]
MDMSLPSLAIIPTMFFSSIHPNESAYTLATVHTDESSSLSSSSPSVSYGTTPLHPPHHARRVVVNATLKMAAIFLLSSIFLGGTLWISLPILDPEDRPLLHIPKSFSNLQDLNYLLKKYRDIYPFRVFVSYVITYLFLQAFSLPGSMYLSILGGAVWGVARALPLACACVATGATLCYFISAALGPALLTLPAFQSRLELWSAKISAQRANLIPFLIVLRIAPLPPHWVVNVLAPHLGIDLIPFWCSTFLGIFGVTVIHTSIGGSLDEMTSAADFHLISWRNFLTLAAVVVGAMIPVGIRYIFAREAADVGDEEPHVVLEGPDDTILVHGQPLSPLAKNRLVQSSSLVVRSEDGEEDLFGDETDDEDVILEAGPSLVIKGKDPEPPRSPIHRRATSSSSSEIPSR